MKRIKFVIVTMLSVSLFSVILVNNVNASTWHKGTPTDLRGTYKHIGKSNPKEKYRCKMTFTKISMIYDKATSALTIVQQVQY